MSKSVTIQSIDVAGFRAFLNMQTLPLSRGSTPLSLAIFAPNARGKSSLVDAVEYFFSTEGVLVRMGERRSGTSVGREPLVHLRAKQDGVTPVISISFNGLDGSGEGERPIPLTATPRPKVATSVLGLCRADFIIRGHELRTFVENRTPKERYSEVSRWFGFAPLVALQDNLRSLRRGLRQALKDDTAFQERLHDLLQITGGSVTAWDEGKVLSWINSAVLAPLSLGVVMGSLDQADPVVRRLQEEKVAEDMRVGLALIEAAVVTTRDVFTPQSADGAIPESGKLIAFEGAVSALAGAKQRREEELARTEDAGLKNVWSSAYDALQPDSASSDQCPVCETSFSASPCGSREGVVHRLKVRLDSLRAYRDAEVVLEKAQQDAREASISLQAACAKSVSLVRQVGLEESATTLSTFAASLGASLLSGEAVETSVVRSCTTLALSTLESSSEKIRQQQGATTFAYALKKVEETLQLKRRLEALQRERGQLTQFAANVEGICAVVDARVRSHIQTVLDALKDETNALARQIQECQDNPPPSIRFDLPPASDTDQQRLTLVLDCDGPRGGTAPHGYLSDAQIHTLALSLRLASIKLLNSGFPVVVLDDVVTSYDTDHRRSLAATLAGNFKEHQVLIVTHDELFFRQLKELMPAARWTFKRILRLDPGYGPRFDDHRVTDEMIRAKWDLGDSAANDIRQAEEEWLLARCQEFGVDVRIREINKPYSYERAELAEALLAFLRKLKVEIPPLGGSQNPFLVSLQQGVVENFGSHFQGNPNAQGSQGDERKRWAEFAEFCSLFICACGSTRFKRPISIAWPVCNSCNTRFTLRCLAPSTSAADPGTTSDPGT